jgi:hypothetical protein
LISGKLPYRNTKKAAPNTHQSASNDQSVVSRKSLSDLWLTCQLVRHRAAKWLKRAGSEETAKGTATCFHENSAKFQR